jgi:hypothetical protein
MGTVPRIFELLKDSDEDVRWIGATAIGTLVRHGME